LLSSYVILFGVDCISFHCILFSGQLHSTGERHPAALRHAAAAVIGAQPLMTLEYVSLADASTGRDLPEEDPYKVYPR